MVQKEREYCDNLSSQLRQEEEETENNVQIRPVDHVRFACLFHEEELYEAYLRLQVCLTRPQIDAGQSGAGTEFGDLALTRLNNPDWQPESEAVPDLHSNFAIRRAWLKGD